MTGKSRKPLAPNSKFKVRNSKQGSVLALAALAILILTILGFGLLTVAYGARLHAVMMKNEALAKMTAEAGYEKAVWWMSRQRDLLAILAPPKPGRGRRDSQTGSPTSPVTGTATFPNSYCDYQISLDHFVGARPVYRVQSTGYCGRFTRLVDALVVQAIGGWDIGSCRLPTGVFRSSPKNFTGNEIINMPIHINRRSELYDAADIYVSKRNKPSFSLPASMAESRYRGWGRTKDKYAGIISLFEGGIYFGQPDSKITDPESLDEKVERFEATTKHAFTFSQLTASADVPNAQPAVQLEFYLDDSGVGMVRITRDCTVRCSPPGPYDYMVAGSGDQEIYTKYDIYGYHYMESNNRPRTYKIEGTYVRQQLTQASGAAERGGQIFVDGNVIIGGRVRYNPGIDRWQILIDGNWYPNQVKGALTVVATGNIWIAGPINYAGQQVEKDEGGLVVKIPDVESNENVLGLFSQNGVVKIIDPGLAPSTPLEYAGLEYKPVACGPLGSPRYLPDPMVVQAVVTVGRGGWGAENYGSATTSGKYNLILTGAICEATRGLVAETADGYRKYYYFDKRLLDGILPGDMWLQGKFTPARDGWRDYRG